MAFASPRANGRPVFLTGMMGSGKTTVGRLLASLLGAGFVDLDLRTTRISGRAVADLFAESEETFRQWECAALDALVAEPAFAQRSVVVAAGGGTVVRAANRASMSGAGRVFFLDVPVPVLVARLLAAAQRDARPLLRDSGEGGEGLPARLGDLLESRRAAYLDKAVRIDAAGAPEAVAEAVLVALDAGAQSGDTQAGPRAI